jgi:hypothetical protein
MYFETNCRNAINLKHASACTAGFRMLVLPPLSKMEEKLKYEISHSYSTFK